MTTPYLLADLRRDEGCVLHAYLDTVGVWTIGYGHTGKEVHKGLVWTQAQAEDALASDVARVVQSLDAAIPWWRKLNGPRADVVANMGFNTGLTSLLSFHNTLGAVEEGRWEDAAAGMLRSVWASQVGHRATRLSEQMRTGVRA